MRLFLSYSRQKEKQAREIYDDLRDNGLDVWFDQDQESLLPGQEWEPAIRTRISESDIVILLLSTESVDRRGFFQKEIRIALDVLQTVPSGHVYLLPARLNACRIPEPLGPIHCVDLFPDYGDGLRKMCEAIRFQRELQQRARAAESESKQEREKLASVLLVNDEPSTMNALVDHWKSCGLDVRHAFNVPQAIQLIDEIRPDVIVSDLSHYSFGKQVTDRAAFEIMEWGAHNTIPLKVIVTCAEITDERRKEAKAAGVVGICNEPADIYRCLNEAAGLELTSPFPAAEATRAPDITDNVQSRNNSENLAQPAWVFLWYHSHDIEFVRKLADDLQRQGINAMFHEETIRFGATLFDPVEEMMSRSDCVVFVLTKDSTSASWLQNSIYKAFVGKKRMVIPAVLDDAAIENMPSMLRSYRFLDFRSDYKKALADLTMSLGRKDERRDTT